MNAARFDALDEWMGAQEGDHEGDVNLGGMADQDPCHLGLMSPGEMIDIAVRAGVLTRGEALRMGDADAIDYIACVNGSVAWSDAAEWS